MKPLKTLSCRWSSFAVGMGLLLSTSPLARAEITVESTNSFGGVSIVPTSGTVTYTSALTTSAYAQAGAGTQYSSSPTSVAGATDVPAPGGLAMGYGAATGFPTGLAIATGYVPGTTAGYDTSEGQASASGVFQITGVTGPVSVNLSAAISGGLFLNADAFGVSGRGESIFTLSLNGTPDLFSDTLLTIGPNQNLAQNINTTLTGTVTLMANTPYFLYEQSDAEADVVNGTTAVPEPAASPLLAAGLVLVALVSFTPRRPRSNAASRLFLAFVTGAAAGSAVPAQAMYIGSDAPNVCKTCGAQSTKLPGGTINSSLSEGNNEENYPVVTVKSAYGPTLPFALSYNSYNADGSKIQQDLGLGFGWTHAYTGLLFQQRGQMFRLGADGRVTQYLLTSPGTYTSDTGYFETLTTQPDGSFIVTNKFKCWWHFGAVPHSSLLIQGPVYQLLQLGDRNQNTNTMSYDASGLLASVSDTYGRTLQFTYDASNHLSSVTDPLGRTTTFQYDSQDRELTQITDPLGNTTRYTYNSQYQMTRKLDRNGQMYFYTYKNQLPFMVTDGGGQPYFSMVNPSDWSVNSTNLAYSLRRSYNPSTTTSTDGNGNAWKYAYDTNGYMTQVTAPDGSATRYTYDPGTLKIASVTDANNNTTRYQYDAEGNRIQMTDALGNLTTYTYDPVFNEMTTMTDPNGRTTTWQYDAAGNRIEETDALGQTRTWTYDSHGDVLSYTDKMGNTTLNQYDAVGNLIRMTDPLGDTTTYTYDAVGNQLSTTDANGHTTRYTYDADDRLIRTTDALGYSTSTTYDQDGNVVSKTDANGHTTAYTYDTRNRMVSTSNALGGITRTVYDADDNVLNRTDEDGHITTYAYDALNRQTNSTDPLGGVTSMAYDPVGNVTTRTDADGHTTTNSYDALNRRIATIDPLGYTTTYEYASIGGPPCCGATAGSELITGVIDADGKYTYYHYDELNRRIQTVQKSGGTNDTITPLDAVTTTTYDANDNRIAMTDPITNTTTYTYDAINRQIGMTNAAGDVTATAYDPVGNVMQTIDPRGNITTTVYDADNRQIQVTDSLGPVSTTAYDPVGNVISTTDGDGNVTTATYDAMNRRVGLTDPLGHASTTVYDPAGNVLSKTDRNGNTTSYAYDADDRLMKLTDPLGNITATSYDPVGNVISTIDPLGHSTTYQYDADNRQIQETDADAHIRTYAYDGTGHMISRLDQAGRTTTYQYNDFYFLTNRQYSTGTNDQYIYDLHGRMISSSRDGWTNTYTYDGADRALTSVQNGRPVVYSYVIPSGIRNITYPGGTNATELYDLRSRLIQVDDGASPPLARYAYDSDDNVLGHANRNGTSSSYAYNANNWITNLVHTNASALIAGFAYAYDNEGNKAWQLNEAAPSLSEVYSYDAFNRLTNYDVGVLSGGTIPSPSIVESYGLDAPGNWSTYVSNSATQTRVHNAVNEIMTINGNPLTYDACGNLLDDGSYSYTYDVENRVTTVSRDSDSSLVGQYSYDAVGRRVITVASPAGSAVTNLLFYDGRRIVEDQSAGATVATYTYGNGVDEVLTMNRGGQTYYYHPNAVFSVEAVTDSTGTPVERYTYDAYGRPAVMDGSYNPLPLNAWGAPHSAITNSHLFTGRELDEESGIYFYRARYYDPGKGRFLQRDPLGPVDGLNLYEYVADNPLLSIDPSGTKTCRQPICPPNQKYEGPANIEFVGFDVRPNLYGGTPAAIQAGWDAFKAAQLLAKIEGLVRVKGTPKVAQGAAKEIAKLRGELAELAAEGLKKIEEQIKSSDLNDGLVIFIGFEWCRYDFEAGKAVSHSGWYECSKPNGDPFPKNITPAEILNELPRCYAEAQKSLLQNKDLPSTRKIPEK